MPIHDWQFWVATTAMLVALLALARGVLPQRLLPRFLRKRAGTPATLTLRGKAIDKG